MPSFTRYATLRECELAAERSFCGPQLNLRGSGRLALIQRQRAKLYPVGPHKLLVGLAAQLSLDQCDLLLRQTIPVWSKYPRDVGGSRTPPEPAVGLGLISMENVYNDASSRYRSESILGDEREQFQ